jgi:secreted trypsin-like serine protease
MISEKLTCFSVIIGSLFLLTSAQECGNVKYTSELIYGGEYAKRGQWPWLCAVHDTVSDEFFCGSTLISKKHVLTGESSIEVIIGGQLINRCQEEELRR